MVVIRNVIFVFSLVLFVLGLFIEDRGLAMMLDRSGDPVYPISSGSEDGAILKLGLYVFIISAFISLYSMIRRSKGLGSIIAYLACSAFYVFMVFLVSLDSEFLDAAQLGDWLPLAANMVWLFSAIIIVMLGFFMSLKSEDVT